MIYIINVSYAILVNKVIIYSLAVKTWQRVFESQLPKNINLNGITGFCVRRNSESDKRSQLFIRTDKNAAEGEFIFWPLLLIG